MFYFTKYNSDIGILTIASDGQNIIGLWIDGQKHFLGTINKEPIQKDDLDVFKSCKKWLDKYFAKEQPFPYKLPLKPIGSNFRQFVWKCLCEIPYGQVTTYGEIARKAAAELGRETMSAQAVGGAVSNNPISIIIPCHRVVGTNGSLTGYAGGIGKKIKLLELEDVDMSRLFVPKKSTAM